MSHRRIPVLILGHQQGCVAFKTGIFSGLWDVLPCTNKTKYICKHLAVGAPLTTTPPTTTPPPCAVGWTQLPLRSSCFKVGTSKVLLVRTSVLDIKSSKSRSKIQDGKCNLKIKSVSSPTYQHYPTLI